MTTEEKLQHFLDFCMEDVRTRSGKMLDDYMASLEQTFEEHKADAERRAEMRIRIQKENIKRELNKQLSIEQLNIKRSLSKKQDELKDMLFVELRDYLAHFMDSPAYHELLEKQVKEAKEFAGSEEMTIYMDPCDADQVSRLALHHNVTIKVSEYSFLGGIRAVIPSKNILIDNSFATKMEEARHNFTFNLDLSAIKDRKDGENHG
ncbi:V-type ATP synthase subunit E [Clostridium sp. AM58-1XD]|uniref:V-type ATP synthase subunit E n=1 Tax=Clostridium sp. AM58-1XD TaxID=2292307 RepID=UPI000E4E80D3|nr:V-type ATP synthase subunit E [Clostridium sp. AM58-1XD]RGY97380.1 ATPase [Clostridium sp. AM58-1XD]